MISGRLPGSGAANTAMQPRGQNVFGTVAVLPASGTKTSPLNGSTAMECGLESDATGSSTDWTSICEASSITSNTRLPDASAPVTKNLPVVGSYQISSVPEICGNVVTMATAPPLP